MKVLQLNCVYPVGSTGKLVYEIHNALQSNGIESIVCYGRGEKVLEPNVYKTCGELYSKWNNLISRFTGMQYGGCFFSTNKLISIIKKENPDIVHLHCINGYFVNIYRIVSWLKKSGIRTVLTLHAEFMHTANCSHAFECEKWKTGCGNCKQFRKETKSLFFDRTHRSWLKMKAAFDGFDRLTVISVSDWLMERAKQSPILADKTHSVILNGLDTQIFKLYDTDALRRQYGLEKEKIIFHVTPSFNDDPSYIKGGYYVLELAKRLANENVKFFVAGNYSPDLKCPENVVLLGKIKNQQELAKYYSMADVTLLTSKKETFSMVCAESLCCGTPVVGFKAGAPERIFSSEFGIFVDYADIGQLETAVRQMLAKNINKEEICKISQNKFSQSKMVSEYLRCYLGDAIEEENENTGQK